MRIQSFRLRLALWSALLAGVALAGFATVAWWQARAAKIAALDREIRAHAEREVSRRWPPEHWGRYEQDLGRALGASGTGQVLLLAQNRDGLAYRSAAWPGDIVPETLPWPAIESRLMQQGGAGNYPRPLPSQNAATNPPPPFPPPGPPPPQMPPPPVVALSVDAAGKHWRFGLTATPYAQLGIGVDLATVDAEMVDIEKSFVLAMPLALGVIGLGAWLFSARALLPVRRLTATMRGVTAKGLDRRIALGTEDLEFRQMIAVFNGMLERLERSFLQASRFSADAAHELKTPLAILQGQIEHAIAQSEAGSPAQAHLVGILDEVQRLGSISRKLLLLSLADAGRLRLHRVRFDLSHALEELLEDAQMLAPTLKVEGAISPGLQIEADAELIWQVLHNLLGNAIKYNVEDGWIHIAASRQDGRIEMSIANASVGIPAADRERIFERFYRADPAHGREVEGVGLGLSLSREIMRAHGGDLLLAESAEGTVRFVVQAYQVTEK